MKTFQGNFSLRKRKETHGYNSDEQGGFETIETAFWVKNT